MYKIQLTFINPQTGDSEVMLFQFDPAALDQTKWNSAFPAVRSRLDTLITNSTPKEPAKW